MGKGVEPTLQQKLDALKATVDATTFEKLLANPEVERMATRAFNKANEGKSDQALDEIAALFNNALPTSVLACALAELSATADSVEFLSEA